MDKNIYAMYFSATGTTKKIVETIADKIAEKLLQEKARKIDFTLPSTRKESVVFTKNDIVVFGVPVYAGRVPNVLLNYLKMVSGNGALAIAVVLYGNRNYDDGLIELRNILEEDGFWSIAGGAFIGEHSFSKILAADRPDKKDLFIAEEFANQIYQKLSKDETWTIHQPITVKGEQPYRNYYMPRDRQGNPADIRKDKPKTNENCIHCKLCARVCPMGSISFDDVKEFTGICIKCGACVKKCPKQAKYYDSEKYLYHKKELELGYERRAEPELFV